MTNEWINWDGGACPVNMDAEVNIRLRDGSEYILPAGRLVWVRMKQPSINDIIAYRLSAEESK